MKAFELNGIWWLPETPGQRVSGTLSVSERGRAELFLIGALRSFQEAGESHTEGGTTTITFTEASMGRSGVYQRIQGQVGSEGFTLDDCFRTHHKIHVFGGLESEQIRVHRVFKGAVFAGDEALEFHKLFVHMDWLAYWVMESGIDEEMELSRTEDGTERYTPKLALRPISKREFAGPEGATVALGQNYGVAGDMIVERKLTQDFYFSLSHEQCVPLDRLLSTARYLQHLVSIGTGRTAAYSKVSLRHPDIADSSNDKTYEFPIELFAEWSTGTNTDRPKTLIEDDMFFTLPDLGGTDGVARWLNVAASNRSALNRVMSTRYARDMLVSDRLLNCAASLEAYDRDKHSDEIYYAARLRRCAALAGPLFSELVGETDVWVKALKDSRNDVAHHEPGLDESTTAYFLSETAFWLFVICLLQECAVPGPAFDRIKSHSHFRWLKQGIAEVLHP